MTCKIPIILPLLIVVALLMAIYMETIKKREIAERIEAEYGLNLVYLEDTMSKHSNAIHIAGDWDCHVKINNTCYLFTPDGLVVDESKSGFDPGWQETEKFDHFFEKQEQ